MGRIDNLNGDNPFPAIWAAIDALRNANPLQAAAIGRGGLTVYGGGVITIENGGLSVTGYAEISGELRGNGTIDWTGPVFFRGPVQITETLDVTADTRLRGDTTIEGLAKLLSELQVEGKITTGDVRIEDGKIHAGGMVLDPTEHGGAITFPNGAQVFTDGDTIQLVKGNSVVQVSDGYARLQNGGDVVQIDGDGIRMSPAAVSPVSGMGLPAGVMIHGAGGYVLKTDGS